MAYKRKGYRKPAKRKAKKSKRKMSRRSSPRQTIRIVMDTGTAARDYPSISSKRKVF